MTIILRFKARIKRARKIVKAKGNMERKTDSKGRGIQNVKCVKPPARIEVYN